MKPIFLEAFLIRTRRGTCGIRKWRLRTCLWRRTPSRTFPTAQIDIMATPGSEYSFLFMAKGGGSANKTFLYQQTKALLNPDSLMSFLDEKIKTLGTSACPPYHLAIVIGGALSGNDAQDRQACQRKVS